MKEKSAFSHIFRLAVTLFLITAVTAALLAGVNAITKDPIAGAKAAKTRAAILTVLPDGADAQPLEAFPDETGMVRSVYRSDSGYAVEVAPTGFGGELAMMVGISRDGTVLGVSIIQHTETAGLGATAAAQTARGEAFRVQFTGAAGPFAVTKDGGTIDALSGATITSRAVTDGVNAALRCAGELLKGGKAG